MCILLFSVHNTSVVMSHRFYGGVCSKTGASHCDRERVVYTCRQFDIIPDFESKPI